MLSALRTYLQYAYNFDKFFGNRKIFLKNLMPICIFRGKKYKLLCNID